MSRPKLSADELRVKLERRELALLCDQAAFQKLLLRIIAASGIFHDSFSRDSNRAASTDGRRDLGLRLIRWVENASPGAFAAMLVTHGIPEISQPQLPEEPDGRSDDTDS